MKTNLFLFITLLIFETSFVSCSNNDNNTPDDPIGTVSLNMMNEDNGMTVLGNSDLYINKANNFYSPSCLLSSLGKTDGLGSISDILLIGGTNTAAVEPGNAYQIFEKETIREFPSGKLALNIAANYYNVYVVSQMKQENTVTGANVKFVLMDVPKNGLPPLNANIGTLDHLNASQFEITIELPTSDFEFERAFNNLFNVFEVEKEGNKLIVKLVEYSLPQDIVFYIRIRDSYTCVYGRVQ
ncbi:hypothetical protein FACS1894182_04280 [Bacteroidia bacterium]|nr:hypothetical protein FACS1894182_04280 [Bacteroidia bacterium]